MRRIITTAAVGVFAAAATLAFAQGAKDKTTDLPFDLPPGMTEADFEAAMRAASPGDKHKILAQLVGVWRGEGRMWMAPGADPIPAKQKATFTLIMEGRFVQGEFEGDMGGMTYVGMGLYGYDNVAQRFESTMIATMGTGMMRGEGSLSSDGSTIVWNYDYHCAMHGGHTTMRETQRHVDADTVVFHTYMPDPDTGREFKVAEYTFKRVSAGAASAR
ncbi:MAG: DUF1579 domain-containing protein [Phycisphaerales bacterium]|nr:MAG: DUF1579 domain-containing protein [Phycisphaerales bacterium]